MKDESLDISIFKLLPILVILLLPAACRAEVDNNDAVKCMYKRQKHGN